MFLISRLFYFLVLFSYKSAYKLFISGSILSDLVYGFVKQSGFLCKCLWFFPLIYLFSGEFIYIELYSVCRLSCQFYASSSWFYSWFDRFLPILPLIFCFLF